MITIINNNVKNEWDPTGPDKANLIMFVPPFLFWDTNLAPAIIL